MRLKNMGKISKLLKLLGKINNYKTVYIYFIYWDKSYIYEIVGKISKL